MSEQTWVINTEDLQVGTVLGFDLLDANGNILHKAGMPISDRLKERLKSSGIHSVSIRGVSEASPSKVDSLLRDSYDPALLLEISQSLESASAAVSTAIEQLANKKPINEKELEEGAETFVECASKDVAATLAILSSNEVAASDQEIEVLSHRAARLSLLGIILALTQGQRESFAANVGFAGLIHDCSLALHPGLVDRVASGTLKVSDVEIYRNHPLESMDILQRTPGISDRLLEIVSQVHEQTDGSGFPMGLQVSDTKYEATILNAADTFLSLADASSGRKIVRSDILLYMIGHASKGRFCTRAIQAMIKSMSVYPIGSVVVLDDDSKAVVIRANAEAPVKPVVRLLNTSQQRMDLQESKRSVVGPFIDPSSGYQRLAKTEMGEILWGLSNIA